VVVKCSVQIFLPCLLFDCRYANNAFYPFTSVAIFMYCLLPPLALFTDLFFVPTVRAHRLLPLTPLHLCGRLR